MPHPVSALEGVRITSVAVGIWFTVAVSEARAVYSLGIADGCLGHGEIDEEENVSLPKRIEALEGIHVATVAAGKGHALALTRCGRVYSWGTSGPYSPVYGQHWSDSDDGGDGGDSDEDYYAVPHLITALLDERVRAIAAGSAMSCAMTDAGALYTWGQNDYGNLGHGDTIPRYRPTLVGVLDDIRVVEVSMHNKHTLALAADGSVYAFGEGARLGGVSRESDGGSEEVVARTLTPERIPNLKCMVPR
jgi:alpha-tubulin suppressor-like RCC1 family protein